MTRITFPEAYKHADLEMIQMYGMTIFKDVSGRLEPIWVIDGKWQKADFGSLLEWEAFGNL